MMPDELSSTSSIPFATRISTIFCITGTVVEVAGKRVGVGETFVAATVGDAVGIIVAVRVGDSVLVGVTVGVLVAVTAVTVFVGIAVGVLVAETGAAVFVGAVVGILVAVAAVTVFVGVATAPFFQTLT
jgi:hypothetical protein